MSMMKRIFAILLTVAMLVCVLTACNASKDSAKTNSAFLADATQPTGADNAVLQKITSVNITCGKSAIENFAAAELRWYLAKKNIPLADDGYGIALKLDDSVAQNGYQIIADENGLVIAGGNERGLAYGLYAFLEKFVGVRIYSPDTEVIDDSDVMIGVGVLDTFDPAFEIIRNPWYPIERLAEKNNVQIITGATLHALHGDSELDKIAINMVATGEKRILEIDGLFVAIGLIPQNEAFANVLNLDNYGYADSEENCLTKTNGVFVAGDCRKKRIRQVATACADGAIAALAACDYVDAL